MTQTEKLSEKFSNTVGVDLNNQFEHQVYGTIMELIDSLENRLIEILGTKVKLKSSKAGGKIEISYFSNDDLDRIIDIIA